MQRHETHVIKLVSGLLFVYQPMHVDERAPYACAVILKAAAVLRVRMVLQLFMVKPDSLQPTTYYFGVFNMDYYIHQPYSYTLRVRTLIPSRQPLSITATEGRCTCPTR